MIKFVGCISGMFLISISLFGQDSKTILKSSFNKCQSIQNGIFEMTRMMKYMSSKDTVLNSYKISFKKNAADTLNAGKFHIQQFLKDEFTGEILYTGDDFVVANSKDSSAIIMSKAEWAKDIKSRIRSHKYYSPLMNTKSLPLPNDSVLEDSSYVINFIGIENINNASCYHIQTNEIPDNKSAEPMKSMRTECHFWINRADMIPVQYSIAHEMVMNNDTMVQYEINKLTGYEFNNLKNDELFTLNSIPDYYKINDFVPFKRQQLLPKDTIAPDWELPTLNDELISLSSFKGKLVLIDFFYKSCYPCMQALPGLQALHTKYQNKGLIVLGIDPYDKKEDDITTFLAKRGVTYNVLLNGKAVANEYRVSSYPTLYLVDEKGKIIYIQEGYGKDAEKTLEALIEERLQFHLK